MLLKIKQFFSAQLVIEDERQSEHALRLAAAALLIETSRADYDRDSRELQAIENALKKQFELSEQELAELLELAEQENAEATSLYQFTTLIKENYSLEQRSELIKLLWHVAIADGEISKYEDHIIRKIADLIYLPPSEFVKAKLAVIGK